MVSAEPIPVEVDGSLPEAKRRLEDAVAGLCDPVSQVVDGQLLWCDSWYCQLREALPGEQGSGYSGIARSLPPCWIDAMELAAEIDTAVAIWEARPQIDVSDDDLPPMTVLRLQAIERRGWRPQDTKSMDQISGIVEAWAGAIKALLSPVPKWSLPNPCPACNTAVVYRKDSAGDVVRQPALQIGPNGCECMRCHHIWAPTHFQHLASVLGYELPAGVLE